jgi:hypothetical protein
MTAYRKAAVFASLLFSVAAFAAQPNLVPNSVKYRDTSKPHATGRSGNASIDALALLGRDGATTLTVTANGVLDKVQVQPDGQNATNFNNVGSASFTQPLTGLAIHQTLHLQANVAGIDGTRTDVVSADEMVKYRPDLAVDEVRAPQRAMPGTAFVVDAVVHELNGDLGARANCVLSADGVELDRANGIWVDAHDSVGCSFRAVLNTMGAHTLTVSVTGVEPGDWDDGNNSASAPISIAEPFEYYDFGAQESDRVNRQIIDWPGTHEEAVNDEWQQWYAFYGNRMTEMNVDALRMHVVESTNGQVVTEKWSDTMAIRNRTHEDYGDGATNDCVSGFDDYTTFSACVGHWNDTPHFNFQVGRTSQAVTYMARMWDLNSGEETDTYIHYGTGPEGVHYGSTVSLAVSITDGATTIEAAPTAAMRSYSRNLTGGWRTECFEIPPGMLCLRFSITDSGKRGLYVSDGGF